MEKTMFYYFFSSVLYLVPCSSNRAGIRANTNVLNEVIKERGEKLCNGCLLKVKGIQAIPNDILNYAIVFSSLGNIAQHFSTHFSKFEQAPSLVLHILDSFWLFYLSRSIYSFSLLLTQPPHIFKKHHIVILSCSCIISKTYAVFREVALSADCVHLSAVFCRAYLNVAEDSSQEHSAWYCVGREPEVACLTCSEIWGEVIKDFAFPNCKLLKLDFIFLF